MAEAGYNNNKYYYIVIRVDTARLHVHPILQLHLTMKYAKEKTNKKSTPQKQLLPATQCSLRRFNAATSTDFFFWHKTAHTVRSGGRGGGC